MAIRLHSSSAARRARHPLQAPNNRLQRSSQEPPGPHAGRRVPAVEERIAERGTDEWFPWRQARAVRRRPHRIVFGRFGAVVVHVGAGQVETPPRRAAAEPSRERRHLRFEPRQRLVLNDEIPSNARQNFERPLPDGSPDVEAARRRVVAVRPEIGF